MGQTVYALCSKCNRLLGFIRQNTRFIKNVSVRQSICLMLLRSHLGYATQVWAPQLIELICKMKQIQLQKASKYILHLPLYCQQTYKDRLTQLNLLLLTYWHEYLDMGMLKSICVLFLIYTLNQEPTDFIFISFYFLPENHKKYTNIEIVKYIQ